MSKKLFLPENFACILKLSKFQHYFQVVTIFIERRKTNHETAAQLISKCSSIIAGVFPYKCAVHQLHFQKVLGFRPQFHSASPAHLLHHDAQSTAINQICLAKCRDDIECSSYVLFFNTSECYGFSLHDRSTRYEPLRPTDDLVADSMAVYFEKICLSGESMALMLT